ncbi:hypothetical protein KIH87_04280 [Paraneptunicella aestuarii]|uniref:hypothetical protein n=1 Tax=Paraneptunicella aestuarii TaxID=2831148 RepID=UPI001E4036CF|nr:hypothetical protein [Paraneptunicella aestuarii]UAA39582.1 hypothetical protein KIH87_04280 [Paraneptunicella aestuarii]
MRYILLFTITLISLTFKANALANARCTVLYSLHGNIAEDFEEQKQALSSQIKRQGIQMQDLNDWQKTTLSGRERNQLRKAFNLPRQGNHIAILNHKGRLTQNMSEHIDLVDILMSCRD